MAREVTQAHYLHERSGLEAVLRAPVSDPCALAWIPGREELLVCTLGGDILVVDPVLGTQVKARNVGEAEVLAVHPDRKRYVVMAREGHWHMGRLGGAAIAREKHGFREGMQAFWLGEHAVLMGDGDKGREIIVANNAGAQIRLALPDRALAGVGTNGKLAVARSLPPGLLVRPLGRKTRFSAEHGTAHELYQCHEWWIGITRTGLAMWKSDGGQPLSMRFPELTAADVSKDGRLVGLGTRNGAVALARIDDITKRVSPDLVKAFESPVRSVAFSSRGRWLATAAEHVQLWSWEE